jgi:putative DNA primase/helicase
MTVAELLAEHGIKLENTASGRYYTTCPQCSAKRSKEHQSNKCLGVTIDSKGVRWGCNHCGWTGPEKGSGNASTDAQTFYNYRDAAGVVRFRKVRNPPGRTPKFYLQRPDGNGGWFNGVKGIDTSILYRVDEVAKAIESGAAVCIVEGEKDVDRLWSLGIAASCNAHGASESAKQVKWTKAHSEQIKGADIVVLNDNDAAGYAHADAAAKLSLGIAKRVRRLDLAKHWPDMPKGNDVSDWLDGGHAREELDELIASAPDYESAKPEGAAATGNGSANGIDDDAELEALARLAPLDYERARKDAGKKLGVSRLALLDALVKAKRAELGLDGDEGKQGHAISFPEPEPWPQPVDGAELLDEIATAIRNHVVMSDAARDAAALWVLHTYLTDCFLVSPRLGVRSPTKGCGKTLLLDVLGRLVLRPLPTANVTPAAIFRVTEAYRPCLLVDEADTFLRENDELRGVLNGNRKGSQVLRTVGDDHEPRAFATYSACAIALIGTLPDTLHDRAVTIDLKRRLPSERVEPFRPDRADSLDVLARKAARWAKDHAARLADADPPMPAGVINRAADNWRPMLAIADEAAGGWSERARTAAEAAHIAAGGDEASRLELLLGDIRDAFTEAEMPSADLVKALVAIEGRPWAELGKSQKPLTQTRLARLLKPLGIAPSNVGPEGARVRGYKRDQFKEAFDRYLAPEGASEVHSRTECDETGPSEDFKVHSPEDGCAPSKCEKPNNGGLLGTWALSKGETGKERRPQGFTFFGIEPFQPCAHCGSRDGVINHVRDDRHLDRPSVNLHESCLDAWSRRQAANGGSSGEPGLSRRRIQELGDWYQNEGHQRYCEDRLDTAELDAELRLILREEVAFPEHVEIEFERIMQAVFAV